MVGTKVVRISFSRSLCDHMARVLGAEVKPIKLRLGKPIPPGSSSPNGLYAVCKTSGWPLRITMFQELAERWRHETRDVRECWVSSIG